LLAWLVLIFSGNQPEADEEFCHCAASFPDCADDALGQSAAYFFAKLAHSSRLRGMLVQLALTKFIYVLCSSGVLRLQTDMAELLTPFALPRSC